MTKEERMTRGARYESAKQLFEEMIDLFIDETRNMITETKPREIDLREGLYDSVRVAQVMKAAVFSIILDGKMARRDIREIADIKSGKKKLFH